jgi:type I restriction enzyme M protein
VNELGKRDENAQTSRDSEGNIEADKELKDFERVPLNENVHDYFKREVKPYIPDAWIDESVRDEKDGQVGIVGYEIPFVRYFYKHTEPRKVEEIESEIKNAEVEVQQLLKELSV